ncbi:MAG: Radical SAM superfamily protein [Methanosaeta sp. PtaB.Bin039]|nr:MAG: Radical SAM superfamily protein [Methanosaeta sp. PtaB.Bin039]HOT06179.1 methyl coenzyme M reductase-arginine methyltransferase Mmp10 [Methanotrichaceae archaeon]HQF15512.1 methyl coenzyme M reductase-arginine methyltransferase Mmp10 [Methanotrichaceae archaeon]HQI90247.1 methyl coenzyme M reductase-arginine methyltransferase Mmp10 [Methanotrichaceae archaeon]HQJ27784.1 methyl coenzyme M reductase-arginine methyltransferase Mmp10 [Methanotrichaceae archaeon]
MVVETLADVGGRPGLDCNGFCSYCYFRGVRKVAPFGCKNCMPFSKGCDYCTRAIAEGYPGFKPMNMVAFEVAQASFGVRPDKVTISGGGDLSCYPDLLPLSQLVGKSGVPIHLGYTSGKGFRRGDEAEALIRAGVREVSFTVFSTDPDLRRRWMNDKNAIPALSNLRTFCQSCDVYAAAVMLKGVNDGPALEKTCADLEEMGARGLILMRFANSREQGLILGNAPIIPDQQVHGVEEFRDLVADINNSYHFRVTGTPLWDPETGAPFALARRKDMLPRLPEIRRSATVITSLVAAPLLREIFSSLTDRVNVLATGKDVGCLMTIEDLQGLDLSSVKRTAIVPGRMLAHDREIRQALSRDGVDRMVIRGPERLSVDGEMSISMTEGEVLELEIEAFSELIEDINALGV